MLIDGEKWACEACIRGHRVSGCQHTDRPLSHINRKGRPVSQCPHCRGLRKARTTHGKCECGERPHTKAEHRENDSQPGKRKQCCCGHGGRCTCTTKRDSNLATVPEASPAAAKRASTSDLKRLHNSAAKTELLARRHKPRLSDASKRAHPYSIPRSRTFHGAINSSHHLSADNLSLAERRITQNNSPNQDPITSAPRLLRRVRSEHGSPVPDFENLRSQLSPIEIPTPGFFDNSNLQNNLYDYPQHSPGFYYQSDRDLNVESAISNGPPIDWSTFDLPYRPDEYKATYSHPASYTSFDYSTFPQPGLARSSSGEISEPEELVPVARMNGQNPDAANMQPIDNRSEGSAAGMYHLSTAASARLDLTQPQFPMSPVDSLDMASVLRANDHPSQPSPPRSIPNQAEMERYQALQSLSPDQTHNFSPVNNHNLMAMQNTSYPPTCNGTDQPIWGSPQFAPMIPSPPLQRMAPDPWGQ